MGIENNVCIIATTESTAAMEELKSLIEKRMYISNQRCLLTFTPGLINSSETLFFASSGSKVGWSEYILHEMIRNKLVDMLDSFDYEDGSNPFSWVEVSYGDYGQNILRGNCT